MTTCVPTVLPWSSRLEFYCAYHPSNRTVGSKAKRYWNSAFAAPSAIAVWDNVECNEKDR